ncbi:MULTISPECIES: hypothetical protein [Moorena]|nr:MULTISPECIES: hypothetical protein [Moorena]
MSRRLVVDITGEFEHSSEADQTLASFSFAPGAKASAKQGD